MFATGFALLGDLLTAMVITRYLPLVALPVAWLYHRIMTRFLNASRELQRMLSVTQSPVLSFMSGCTDGLYVLRAFGSDTIARFESHNEVLIDANSRMMYANTAGSAWFTLRIQMIGAVILLLIAVLAFCGLGTFINPGLVGLVLSYGLSITNGLQSIVWMVAWFENNMVTYIRTYVHTCVSVFVCCTERT